MKQFLNNNFRTVLAVLAVFAAMFSWYQADAIDPATTVAAVGTVVNFSTDEQRAVYGRLQNWFPVNGLGESDSFIITESNLRVEQLLESNKNQYQFDLYQGSGSTDRPTEIKLNRNDLYFATHVALGIAKYDPSKTPVWYGNFPIFTYPDSNYFVGTGASAAIEYQALETIYQGELTFTTGNVNRFGPLMTDTLKYTPNRPFELGVASSAATTAVFPEYGPTMAGRGFHRLTPNLVVDGQQTNVFTLNLGGGDYTNIAGATNAAGSAVNTRNVLVLQLHGFRAVNAAAAAKAAGQNQVTF
ncbi:MAG: hypothetical protein K9I85_06050 [Saprospiraceae bacterium]|nr:hypothetical protein [Saprospiraceae bacterium]